MSMVSTTTEAIAEMKTDDAPFDMETVFRAHYGRVTRIIGRVVGDRARAEELAVEVFLRLWQKPNAQGENMEGWLYRVAVRAGLDELRRRRRRAQYESLLSVLFASSSPATPEQVRCANEEQERVRLILGLLQPRQAELLLLRSHGFTYEEVASIARLNPGSIGTLVSRAQQAFRKEYVKRYAEG
jgi:RNA polymerase sigma-70 factor, ECF subfamily